MQIYLIKNYFDCATSLKILDCMKITNLTFMKNIKILKARSNCGIDDNGIRGLKLNEL